MESGHYPVTLQLARKDRFVTYKLTRPAADFDAGAGLMVCDHFQMAYVTTDMERAKELFSRQLGIREFTALKGEMPSGGLMHAEFAWVGTMMYELICASGPGSAHFMDRLPQDGEFAIRHHHLGYLIHNQDQWDAVLAHAEREGFPVVNHNVNPLVEVCFVDVPHLGHYLEYLYATELGMQFFESVPRS